MNVQEAFTLFANHKLGEGIKQKTIIGYKSHIDCFINALPDQRRALTNIRPSDITNFLASERARGLSPNSVKAKWRTLNVFFGWCSNNDELGSPANPMWLSPGKRIKAPKVPKKEPRRANLDHLQQVIDAIPRESWVDLRDRALIELMLDTGLRVGEVTNLMVADMDLKKRVLLVRAGKGDKDRRVPFTEQTAKDLLAYWMTKPEVEPKLQHVVFVASKNGSNTSIRGRLTISGIAQLLQRRCQAAGVPCINPHSIRHLFASKAIDDGIRLEVIQRLMGHHDAGFTARTYAHLSTKAIEREYAEHWNSGK